MRVCVRREHLGERGTGRGHAQRVAEQRAARGKLAGYAVEAAAALEGGGELGAHAVGAERQAAADGLADRHDVGLEAPLADKAARPADERVGLVEHEQRPRLAREAAQGVVEARVGQHDAFVGQRRLGEDAGVGAACAARRRAPPGR